MTIDKSSPMLRQLRIDKFAIPLYYVKALNILIVIAWIQAFGFVMAEAFIGNFIQAVCQLPFLFALGFPAWVFWRNIDVVSSVADPQMRIAYLVLGVISWTGVLIFGLGLLVPSDDGDTGPSLVFGLFSQFLIWGIMTLLDKS
jgi:hypothetical protein